MPSGKWCILEEGAFWKKMPFERRCRRARARTRAQLLFSILHKAPCIELQSTTTCTTMHTTTCSTIHTTICSTMHTTACSTMHTTTYTTLHTTIYSTVSTGPRECALTRVRARAVFRPRAEKLHYIMFHAHGYLKSRPRAFGAGRKNNQYHKLRCTRLT